MKIKTLMSAAHAAGYAMAAEDLQEPSLVRPVVKANPNTLPVPVRSRQPVSVGLIKARIRLRRLWLRDWFAGYGTGRATA